MRLQCIIKFTYLQVVAWRNFLAQMMFCQLCFRFLAFFFQLSILGCALLQLCSQLQCNCRRLCRGRRSWDRVGALEIRYLSRVEVILWRLRLGGLFLKMLGSRFLSWGVGFKFSFRRVPSWALPTKLWCKSGRTYCVGIPSVGDT